MAGRRPRARARRRVRRRRWRLWRVAGLAALVLVGVATAPAAPLALLRYVDPPTTAFMLRSHFADPATGRACTDVGYAWVDIARVEPVLALAVLVAEDQRFFQHSGFDFRSIRRALRERGGPVRGASTLSQQLAKNLFLWPGRSWLRKGLEVWLTTWIELLWSKRRILEVYLNVAQFGPCVFGAESASRRFFDVAAADLDPGRAALLAAVLPNPRELRAHNPGPYARERALEIRSLMREHERAALGGRLRRALAE